MTHNSAQDRLDRATSARLAKLASRPVDIAQLQQRIESAIHTANTQTSQHTAAFRTWQRWWRPVTSAAAAILIGITIGWFALTASTSPAMAAPTELAQIHYDVVNGLVPNLKVASVAEANQLLAAQSNGSVPIPELPGIMKSCCLQQQTGTTLTCALIDRDGQLITVALADGAKVHSPKGQTITRGGRQFIAHTANGINMVMAHEGSRWLCVMGNVTTQQLVEVAVQVTF